MATEYEQLVSVEDILKNLWERLSAGAELEELKLLLEDAQSQLHEVVLQYPSLQSDMSREHPLVQASKAALVELREQHESFVECHTVPATGLIREKEDQDEADAMAKRIEALERALGPFV